MGEDRAAAAEASKHAPFRGRAAESTGPPGDGRIFFVLRTGCQWNALNATGLCSSSTAHLRFQEWTAAGVFRKLWALSLENYDELKGLDWSWQSMDGTMTKAPLGGGKNRPQSHGSGQERRQAKPADGGVRRAHRAGD